MSNRTKHVKKRKLDCQNNLDIDSINEHLTKFIVGCGLPFLVVESMFFKNFVGALCKEYVPLMPSRKTLSTKLLTQLHNEIVGEIKTKVSKDVCLLTDSWKNTNGKHQNFAIAMHNAGEPAFFLDSHDMTKTSETSINLANCVSVLT